MGSELLPPEWLLGARFRRRTGRHGREELHREPTPERENCPPKKVQRWREAHRSGGLLAGRVHLNQHVPGRFHGPPLNHERRRCGSTAHDRPDGAHAEASPHLQQHNPHHQVRRRHDQTVLRNRR
uniref:(northern house mosquito) hypothetical protein n=1 Tax=Culex pipiens TaxID=7175 RepID=A0A8D8N5M0_CULPI